MSKWYKNPKLTTYVATYDNDNEMQKEIQAAARDGWVVQAASATEGHINVGRTVTPAVLTGGLSLLF